MGQANSTETASSIEERELESQATSVGALPLLHNSFPKLADPLSNSIPLTSLQQCFSLKYTSISCEGVDLPDCFQGFLDQIAASITDTLFVPQKGGITWTEFVRGYVKGCGRMSASSLLNTLLRALALSAERAGCPMNLQFDSDEADSKTSGSISPGELGMIIWVCWIMSWNSRSSKCAMESEHANIPDLNHLIVSAVVSCMDNDNDVDVWNTDVCHLEAELSVGKIHTWAIRTVPNLAECFSNFINSRLKAATFEPSGTETSVTMVVGTSSDTAWEYHLLTRGRAWAISLSQRSSISEEMLRICFSSNTDVIEESLLYRSYAHGKGLNRFWSNVDGYHGPLLLLLSATSGESSESSRKWIIGALTQQGFENRDAFYGSGGCLYSIFPVFHVFSASGKEQNYLYSHLHPAARAYEPHPKPVGIAFGGTVGHERIFIDEDFAKVTIQHHAADKTYQHGSLFPDQGYLPTEASVLDVEVWGLGGKKAKEIQDSYRNREALFTEQRRKVDLKTFASWEDSPEKMMMDLMASPNAVRREER
ncbi:hypothetical protein BVRB_1g022040 [Beta vulgaris subsp. vulgaris]|uniref:uncharacterized protein LOC104905777 isoform X2 n=1 Tax=Beta vulgaris subsp. vulgaris TaxID=3555 RepID=UPI000540367A|nr:uncharacterized protein LOC104905777 isoform X2 [Beta vulgaris subsp. vulgaris]KMS99635.1 hypothetical protein BVRB_1g022040 [Beta vulgaris subsp. vulgaris]